MARYFRSLIILIAAAPGVALSEDSIKALSLTAAYAVESAPVSGLSGLDWCDGKLLTVDDRGDSKIYQIEFSSGKAHLVEAINLSVPPRIEGLPFLRRLLIFVRDILGRGTFDWEGISCSDDAISLASEIDGSVLRLESAGQATWLYSGYISQFQREGLYNSTFIGIEAITLLDEATLLLAHERSPPALIELDRANNAIAVRDLSDEPETGLQQSESPDITGMDAHNGLLYTLHRNAMLVCIRTMDTYQILDCASYRATERKEEYQYDDMRYGRAEGLAVRDRYIYMVLDNNGEEQLRNSSRQPLFFVFENPWKRASEAQKRGR